MSFQILNTFISLLFLSCFSCSKQYVKYTIFFINLSLFIFFLIYFSLYILGEIKKSSGIHTTSFSLSYFSLNQSREMRCLSSTSLSPIYIFHLKQALPIYFDKFRQCLTSFFCKR